MKCLGDLSPSPQRDEKSICQLYSPLSKTHTGKMKVALIREVLGKYSELLSKGILDPMGGVGSTGIGAVLEGALRVHLIDKVALWAACSEEAMRNVLWTLDRGIEDRLEGAGFPEFQVLCGRSESFTVEDLMPKGSLGIILTSPPFPKSHPQGASEMQKGFQQRKKTYAANEFEDQEEWATYERFVPSLRTVLGGWIPALVSDGVVLVHIKNHVEDGEEIRADHWVRDALEGLAGLQVEGYWRAPLEYLGPFRAMKNYPRRNILKMTVLENGGRVDELECGHTKHRKDDPGPQKQAHCTFCEPTGVKQITEERIVAARRIS